MGTPEKPLLLEIRGEPRLTIEEDGRIIHKGVVIGQDEELADMLMGLPKKESSPHRPSPRRSANWPAT